MKLRRYKTLAVSGLVIAATALTSATALAADVNINAPSADVQQKVVLEKTEAVVPSFAVGHPRYSGTGRHRSRSEVHPDARKR